MIKSRFNGLLVLWSLCIIPLLMLGGCGGGGGSSSSSDSTAVTKSTVTGTISFPALSSIVAKGLWATTPLPIVEVRDLNGTVVATATVSGSGTTADPYRYTTSVPSDGDYVIKVVNGNQTMKALLDKGSITTTTTRNIDPIATTAVIVAEQKLGLPPGTVGEVANSVSSDGIAGVTPVTLESNINAAVRAANNNDITITQERVDLANLANVVNASVNAGIDPATFISGPTTTATITTTQFTLVSGAGVTTNRTAVVNQAGAQTTANAVAPIQRYLQYRITESSAFPYGWIAADPALIRSVSLKDANGNAVAMTSSIWKADNKVYDCMGTACVAGQPYQDLGFTIDGLPGNLAPGNYQYELINNNGQPIIAQTTYVGAAASIPVISSSTMSTSKSSTDLIFTWTNPITATNWNSVQVMRVELFDNAVPGKRFHVVVKPTAQTATLPLTMLTQAGLNPNSATLNWRIQTRFSQNNVNVARGLSNSKLVNAGSSTNTGAFTQGDLTGTWNFVHFSSGPDVASGVEPGWITGNVTVASDGTIAINSMLSSNGSTSTDVGGTVRWTINSSGIITETGTAAFTSAPPMRMSANKQLVVGAASDGNNRLLRVAVKQLGAFSNADLTGPMSYTSTRIFSGLKTNWAFVQGTIDAGRQPTDTSIILPTGTGTAQTYGALSITSTGLMTQAGNPDWHGIMTPDKKLWFRFGTSAANTYHFGVTSLSGQTFTQGDLTGSFTDYALASTSPLPVWEYSTGSISSSGFGSPSTFLDSTGNTSLVGQGGGMISIGPTGLITVQDNATTRGFLSWDKKLLVFTSTWDPGVYSMNLILK